MLSHYIVNIVSVAFSLDGKYLAKLFVDGILDIIDVRLNISVQTFSGYSSIGMEKLLLIFITK